MATRPCFSSASRHLLNSPASARDANPSGSKPSANGAVTPTPPSLSVSGLSSSGTDRTGDAFEVFTEKDGKEKDDFMTSAELDETHRARATRRVLLLWCRRACDGGSLKNHLKYEV